MNNKIIKKKEREEENIINIYNKVYKYNMTLEYNEKCMIE